MSDRIPEDALDPLYRSIGFFMTNWNLVDSLLDTWISVIYQSAGGKHVEKEIPKNFKRKITFLRRCFKRIEKLEPFREEALETVETVNHIGNTTRHVLAHGSLSKWDTDNETYHFRRFQLNEDKTKLKTEVSLVPGRQILEHGAKCAEMMPGMIQLSENLLLRFVPGYVPQKFFG